MSRSLSSVAPRTPSTAPLPSPTMAFSNYSNLFKCGLLSEGSSSPSVSTPWAAEYYGPRRGSLPSADALSEISDFSALPRPPPSSSGTTVESSTPGEETFYFTFKKKRNPAEHRSFLSLDLAESQSLRSVSIKGKDKANALSKRKQQTETSVFSPTFSHSFIPIFSPPAPVSPPGSPISAHSIPDPSNLVALKPSTSSPQRPPTVIHAPSPRRGSYTFPSSPTSPIYTRIQRELSPMRFADPSPPPLNTDGSEVDLISEKSVMSAEVLSRSSTVSSGYRRAQRWDALKRLEGRGADGAVGRLKPRLSQNFMHLSDDEDEDEVVGSFSPGKNMNVIVEDLAGESESKSRQSSKSRISKAPGTGLSVSINGQPWYNLTPRQSAWGVLFGGEVDGDIDVDVDKIFGLDSKPPQPDSPRSDKPRKAKRSKRSYSPRSPQKTITPSLVPFPSQSSTRPPIHLHPLDPSTSTSSTSSSSDSTTHSHSPSPKSPQRTIVPPVRDSHSHSHLHLQQPVRLRTVSDFGSSNPHALMHESRHHHHHHHHHQKQKQKPRTSSNAGHRQKPRLELRLDRLPIEEPSFIDMRDESLESDSRSDSWTSLFEVSCAA